MINRIMIKNDAKAALKTCYIKCVAVALVLLVSMYGFTAGKSGSADTGTAASNTISSIPGELIPFIVGLIGVSLIISIIVRIFLLKPLEIGCRKFFIYTYDGVQPIGIIASPYRSNYINQVKIMFFRDLYLFLWSLLFIIPGIIKSYSYRMIPYILAEDPSVDMADAFDRSIQMMNGRKLEVFVYDLTFYGWYILSAFTFGIVGIFYLYPYKSLADARLYIGLRDGQAL